MVGPNSAGQWTWFETTGQTKWVVEMGSRVVTGHRGIRIRFPNGTGRFAAEDGSRGRFRLTMPNGETFDSDGYTITACLPGTIYDGTEGELYDLKEDPRQWRNLWDDPAHASLKSDLLADLKDHLPPVREDRLEYVAAV